MNDNTISNRIQKAKQEEYLNGNIQRNSTPNKSTINTEIAGNQIKNQRNNTPNKSTTTNNRINNEVVNSTLNNTGELPKSIEELERLQILLDNNDDNLSIVKRPIPTVEKEYKPDFRTRVNLLIEDAKPSTYQLGIQSKYTFLPTFEGLPAMHITNNGVIANALFFNSFRLQIGANYWLNSFEVDNIETFADGIITPFIDEYPTVLPASPLDELAKVEAKSYGFDFPISAQILLRRDKVFTPYIGFGLKGRFTNSYVQEYYFMDNVSGYEYEIKEEGVAETFDFGIWESQLGMDYKIYQNWLVNFEINYLRSFKEQMFGLPNIQQYGASLGVKYEF